MPTIRLTTDDDMRAITSQKLDDVQLLPWLYIPVEAVNIPLPPLDFPTEGLKLMRTWGVAHESAIADYARLFSEGLVAPKHLGQFVDRGELLFNGAEPVTDFLPG